jgi:hypothetical protein
VCQAFFLQLAGVSAARTSAESFSASLERLITPGSQQTQTSACYDVICVSSALLWNCFTTDNFLAVLRKTSADNAPVKGFQ